MTEDKFGIGGPDGVVAREDVEDVLGVVKEARETVEEGRVDGGEALREVERELEDVLDG